jgi:hypothetical protein
MNKKTLNFTQEILWQDPIFQNKSTSAQALVYWQLACTLDWLGIDGHSVSHARSKIIWGVAQGAIDLYTKKVVEALCKLEKSWIQRPIELKGG